MRYSHHGCDLCRPGTTDTQNLEIYLRKCNSPRFSPRFISGRILRIVMTFVKFWDSSYNRSHEMIHFQFKILSFPTINLLCYGSIIMLSMLKLHDLWKWSLIFSVYLITWVFLRRWRYFLWHFHKVWKLL